MPLDRTTALQRARRLAVAVLGGSVILLAAILFFTPAPSSLVFLVGLGILASEFLWAGRLLQRVKNLRKKDDDPVEDDPVEDDPVEDEPALP